MLLAEGRILKGREGNNLLVYVCRTNSLFFLFLSFFVSVFPLIFPFFSFSLFSIVLILPSIVVSVALLHLLPLLRMARAPFLLF